MRHASRLVLVLLLLSTAACSTLGERQRERAAGLALAFTDPSQLIALRAAMGVGAAAIMPTTLSVITTSFPVDERPRAIGVWVGIAGGGAVLGLFASGLLLEFFAWQSFFALNVVLATIALCAVLAVVPSSVDEHPPALDWVGAALSLLAVGGTVFGIIEGPERGWDDPVTIGALVAGVLAAVVFVIWELRRREPMLDPRLFLLRGLSAGTLTITVQFFAAFGFFFIVMQYLQYVTGRSPLEAAVALLPLPFILLPIARNAPHAGVRSRVSKSGEALRIGRPVREDSRLHSAPPGITSLAREREPALRRSGPHRSVCLKPRPGRRVLALACEGVSPCRTRLRRPSAPPPRRRVRNPPRPCAPTSSTPASCSPTPARSGGSRSTRSCCRSW